MPNSSSGSFSFQCLLPLVEVWTSPISKHSDDPQLMIWEMNTHVHRLLIPQGWKHPVPKFFYISLTFGWTISKPDQCFLAAPQQAPRGTSLQLPIRNMTTDQGWQAATSVTHQKRRIDRAIQSWFFKSCNTCMMFSKHRNYCNQRPRL